MQPRVLALRIGPTPMRLCCGRASSLNDFSDIFYFRKSVVNSHLLHLHHPLQLTASVGPRNNNVPLALGLSLLGLFLPADQQAHLQLALALSVTGLPTLFLLGFLYFELEDALAGGKLVELMVLPVEKW